MRTCNRMLTAFAVITIILSSCTKKQMIAQQDPPAVLPEKENPKTSDATWAQNEFMLSTFFALPGSGDTAVYRKILTYTKESGINLVELTFLSRAALIPALDVAENVGVKTLVEDLSSFSGFQTTAPSFTEDTVINTVNWLNNYPMVEGYYLWDEPYQTDFSQVRILRDLFKEHDPARLAFSVILPSYGPYTWADSSYPAYVDNYLSTVEPEVVSFDYYPFRENLASVNLVNNDLWKDFGYIRKKALQYNKPLWFYFQAIGMQPGQTSIMNLERIQVQMYAALAYGVKGLSYYTSHEALIDATTYDKTPLFNDLKTLNTAVKHIGNFLFNKQSEELYQTGILAQNQNRYYLDKIDSSDLLHTAPDNLVIGLFGDSTTTKYVLVTNKNFSAETDGVITLRRTAKVSEFNKTTNTTAILSNSTDSIIIQLPPGEAALYIIE
ncbi:hypothetical protein [Chitinophaga sp. MM2321]|uniref:hypothetical protein n=1 Tax=Chitinophaga sp. MM2321 TaxID=3137178 RepID=UPI0032D5B077